MSSAQMRQMEISNIRLLARTPIPYMPMRELVGTPLRLRERTLGRRMVVRASRARYYLVELKGGHVGDIAGRRCLFILIHVDLDKLTILVDTRHLDELRPNLFAGPAPGGRKVHAHQLPGGVGTCHPQNQLKERAPSARG